MDPQTLLWSGFGLIVVLALGLDLFVFHRRSRTASFRESLTWVCVWATLALLFNVGVWLHQGQDKAFEFFTGYLIEISLSMDNVFVFVLIFRYFAVPESFQRKVLFVGIVTAMILRGVMIALGAVLIHRFEWILYAFGAFLVYTGFKMALKAEERLEPDKNPVVRLFCRVMPMTREYRGDRFVVREHGRLLATPLAVVLVMVETSDVIFAVDSVPAIFAVTKDPFIVYTSNIFAILGLRAMYFVLSHAMDKLSCLKYGLGLVLAFVGTKMLLESVNIHIPTGLSLLTVVTLLALSVAISLLRPPPDRKDTP